MAIPQLGERVRQQGEAGRILLAGQHCRGNNLHALITEMTPQVGERAALRERVIEDHGGIVLPGEQAIERRRQGDSMETVGTGTRNFRRLHDCCLDRPAQLASDAHGHRQRDAVDADRLLGMHRHQHRVLVSGQPLQFPDGIGIEQRPDQANGCRNVTALGHGVIGMPAGGAEARMDQRIRKILRPWQAA